MIKILYNRCTGIYKFGNNTYPRRIRRRSNLGHIFRENECVLWAGKYGNCLSQIKFLTASIPVVPSWPDYHYGKYMSMGLKWLV